MTDCPKCHGDGIAYRFHRGRFRPIYCPCPIGQAKGEAEKETGNPWAR